MIKNISLLTLLLIFQTDTLKTEPSTEPVEIFSESVEDPSAITEETDSAPIFDDTATESADISDNYTDEEVFDDGTTLDTSGLDTGPDDQGEQSTAGTNLGSNNNVAAILGGSGAGGIATIVTAGVVGKLLNSGSKNPIVAAQQTAANTKANLKRSFVQNPLDPAASYDDTSSQGYIDQSNDTGYRTPRAPIEEQADTENSTTNPIRKRTSTVPRRPISRNLKK